MKTLLVFLFLAAPALAVAGDASLQPVTGARVRFKVVGGHRLTGEVVGVLPDALMVRIEAPQEPVRRLDLSRLERLELSQGRRRHAGAGFVIGFIPGALLGGFWGVFACFDAERPCDATGEVLLGGLIVGTVTGLVGALMGWAMQTDRWQAVHLPGRSTLRLEPAVTAVRGGVAAGLRLRF